MSDDPLSPAKVVYKRSFWSLRAALQALIFSAVSVGMATYVSVTYSAEAAHATPGDSLMLFIVGVVLSIMLGLVFYSMSKERIFLSMICDRYGYTYANLVKYIIEDSLENGEESRMLLLPSSPVMGANVDIFVRRSLKGVFVEEVHNEIFD